MRDYAKLAPTFWTGNTGKELRRRGIEGVVVAVYLMSAPGSNMLGLYYQPALYMAHETGLGIEGASKGLRDCIDVGFCSYDAATEMVFVHEMAAWQIAEALSPGDKRCKGIQKDYESLPANPFLEAWYERYRKAFHLTRQRSPTPPDGRPIEAPPKPGTGTGAGTGAGTGSSFETIFPVARRSSKALDIDPETGELKPDAPAPPPPAAPPPEPPRKPAKRASRIPEGFKLPKAWGEWALAEFPQWNAAKVRLEADRFADHWRAKSGKDATKLDWLATWRNWCRSPIAHADDAKPGVGGASLTVPSSETVEAYQARMIRERAETASRATPPPAAVLELRERLKKAKA